MKFKQIILFIEVLFICNLINAQVLTSNDVCKYYKAFEYVLNDSINRGKPLCVSDSIVDLDRFWFIKDVKNDTNMKKTLESLVKYKWFGNYYLKELNSLWGGEYKAAESILFFSSIEKNTLRVDLFIKRYSILEYNFEKLIQYNKDKIYAYLFFFDCNGNIKKVFNHEIIYGI